MKVTPYQMESLTSFVHRAAAVQSKDLRSYLRELFPSEDYRQKVSFPEDLDALEEGAFMAALNGALDGQKRRLSAFDLAWGATRRSCKMVKTGRGQQHPR